MGFEHRVDGGADDYVLVVRAQKIADHADIARLGQLHQDGRVAAPFLQRGMHRMPGPLPAIDQALALDLMPSHIE